MLAQRFVHTAAVPRPWAWAALSDARTLSSWSPLLSCEIPADGVLASGAELGCTLDVLSQPVGATLCVLDVQVDRRLALRIESLAATLFETFALDRAGAGVTRVNCVAEAHATVPSPAVRGWFAEHAEQLQSGLQDLLTPHGPGQGEPSNEAPPQPSEN